MTLRVGGYNALHIHSVDTENGIGYVVPGGGLEPPRLAAPDFESGTSTSSITPAKEPRIIHESTRHINYNSAFGVFVAVYAYR